MISSGGNWIVKSTLGIICFDKTGELKVDYYISLAAPSWGETAPLLINLGQFGLVKFGGLV